jgi:Zn-dependent protease/CBS domain-containing protein
MRSWSIPIGRLFGVDVRIHLTFIILPMFIFWTDYLANDGKANGSRDLALAGIILACVAAHEWGHILMARRFGLTPKGVILLPLTGVTLYDETVAEKSQRVPQADSAPSTPAGVSADVPTWERETVIAAVGPLVSLALASIAAAVVMGAGRGADLWKWPFLRVGNLPCSLVWANLYLAILNLLPAHPLDGGRILRAVFSRTMGASAATRRAVSISNAIAMVLIFAGLVSNNWLTMVGIVVFSAAQLEERALVFQWVLDNVRLEEVMLTDFATLSPADTLEDALEKAVHSLQDDFPVVRGSDMVGVISKQRILDALRAEGNGYVQAVMNKIFEISVRQDSLGSAFSKLTARSSSVIPIVEDQRLVGIVTLQNLMHSTALLAESRKLRRDEAES